MNIFFAINSDIGPRALFYTGSGGLPTIKTISYFSEIVRNGTYLADNLGTRSASGNHDKGIFAGGNVIGNYSSRIEKYQYAGDIVEMSLSLLSIGRWQIIAHSNSENCFFTAGSSSFTGTDKYNYSNEAMTSGISIDQQTYGGASVNTADFSISASGNRASTISNHTFKYTYSPEAIVEGTVLGEARENLAAIGNTSKGIFAGGEKVLLTTVSSRTDIYDLSSGTVSAGNSLAIARDKLGGASNSIFGFFSGGDRLYSGGGWTGYTDKYIIDTNVVASGTALDGYSVGIYNSSTSSTPGGF